MTPAKALSVAVAASEAVEARTPKSRTGRPASPCGTTGAYARHLKFGEPACEPCKDANKLRQAELDEAKHAAQVAAGLAKVAVVDGMVQITASVADARMSAAALLDRAIALEPSRHTASAGAHAVKATEQIAALKALHSRIAQAARAEA